MPWEQYLIEWMWRLSITKVMTHLNGHKMHEQKKKKKKKE